MFHGARCAIALLLFAVPLFFIPTSVSGQSAIKHWVYFIDKGPQAPVDGALAKGTQAYERAIRDLSQRALQRRAKTRSENALADVSDLPMHRPYLEAVERTGATLVRESRWLNAASFVLTGEQIRTIQQLSFVVRIEPVRAFRRDQLEPVVMPHAPFPAPKTTTLDYGPSFQQLQFIRVPELHEIGVSGTDVLIGMLDTGFRWRAHEALSSRTIVGEYDFIFNDSTTADEAGDIPGQDSHGTCTMSVVGGFAPGQLIGPAFNASFILGKTEDIRSETQIEEDNWAAAIEWMEREGVDVVSSSLGYDIFDDGTGYRWSNGDFDGRTSVTARAAVRAARLGVVVSTAMGNQRNGDGIVGTLISPADADSIISVGAVGFSGRLAGFSSTGPTNDNRIKPDVVAPGVSVYCAGPENSYIQTQGTSLSTPLVAGAAALVLSARPELTPVQVRDALRATAKAIDSVRFPIRPNNFVGWGLVDAFEAALAFGPVFSNQPDLFVVNARRSAVALKVMSKSGIVPNSVNLHYSIGTSSTEFNAITMMLDSAMFFPTSGRYRVTIPPLERGTIVRFFITASDSAGRDYQSPPLSTGRLFVLRYGESGTPVEIPEEYVLHPNFPNPFPTPANPVTVIRYDLPRREHVRLKVFNLLGEEVANLVDAVQEGPQQVTFDAVGLPSGVYFYQLVTPRTSLTRRMLIVR